MSVSSGSNCLPFSDAISASASETFHDLFMTGGIYNDGASGTSSGTTTLNNATLTGGTWKLSAKLANPPTPDQYLQVKAKKLTVGKFVCKAGLHPVSDARSIIATSHLPVLVPIPKVVLLVILTIG